MRRFYLAGPMTGLPSYGYEAFEEAAQTLRSLFKLNVLSPHENFPNESLEQRGKRPYAEYIEAGLAQLKQCTDIILLPGFERSRGVMEFELPIAITSGYGIYSYYPGNPPELKKEY